MSTQTNPKTHTEHIVDTLIVLQKLVGTIPTTWKNEHTLTIHNLTTNTPLTNIQIQNEHTLQQMLKNETLTNIVAECPGQNNPLFNIADIENNHQISQILAGHPHIPQKFIDRCIQTNQTDTIITMLTNPSLNENVLDTLYRYIFDLPDDKVTLYRYQASLALSYNPNCSLKAAKQMLKTQDLTLAIRLASATKHQQLVDQLIDHPDHAVRAGIASQKNLSADQIEQLAADKHHRVREAAAKHQHIPQKTLLTLTKDRDPEVQIEALENLNPQTIQSWINNQKTLSEDQYGAILNNSNCEVETKIDILDKTWTKHHSLLWHLPSNTKLTTAQFEHIHTKLSKSLTEAGNDQAAVNNFKYAMIRLAENTQLTAEMVNTLLENHFDIVWKALLYNPNVNINQKTEIVYRQAAEDSENMYLNTIHPLIGAVNQPLTFDTIYLLLTLNFQNNQLNNYKNQIVKCALTNPVNKTVIQNRKTTAAEEVTFCKHLKELQVDIPAKLRTPTTTVRPRPRNDQQPPKITIG